MLKFVKGLVVASVVVSGVSVVANSTEASAGISSPVKRVTVGKPVKVVNPVKPVKPKYEPYATTYVLKGRETYRKAAVVGGKAYVSRPSSYYRDAFISVKTRQRAYTFHVPAYKNGGTFYVMDAKDASAVFRGLKRVPSRYDTVAFTNDKRMIGGNGRLTTNGTLLTLKLKKDGKLDVFRFRTTVYR